ncbi:MAG: polyamine aminopropyltransferase [Alphaproteobacteria bacterium]
MIRFEETDSPDVNLSLTVSRPIYAGKTAFQAVEVFENAAFGRVLALDGIVQTTERDEFVYHEMLVHPALLAHGAAKRVLVIGGGDGGAIEEAFKHPVDSVTMVEIDPQVIELCRAHLPSICGAAFDDPRLDLVIGDGVAFVAETERRFDVILVDSTEPVGPGVVLFETPFYADCRRRLAPGGVLVTQNAVPFLQPAVARDACRRLKRLFADVTLYLAPVPAFIGGYMAYAWASDDPEIRRTPAETLAERQSAIGLGTRFYTPEVHRSAFALPPYIAEMVG